jgi:hypothetical protein
VKNNPSLQQVSPGALVSVLPQYAAPWLEGVWQVYCSSDPAAVIIYMLCGASETVPVEWLEVWADWGTALGEEADMS